MCKEGMASVSMTLTFQVLENQRERTRTNVMDKCPSSVRSSVRGACRTPTRTQKSATQQKTEGQDATFYSTKFVHPRQDRQTLSNYQHSIPIS